MEREDPKDIDAGTEAVKKWKKQFNDLSNTSFSPPRARHTWAISRRSKVEGLHSASDDMNYGSFYREPSSMSIMLEVFLPLCSR